MKISIVRSVVVALGIAAGALALGGCVVGARAAYPYGYTTYQAPGTVYYNGGYHGGVYYRAGYYHQAAPFVVARPVYAQPVYAQPVYAQPTYVQPAYGAQVGVAVPGVAAGVRVGP